MEGQQLQKGHGRVINKLGITLALPEFSPYHRASLKSPALQETAETILAEASRIWRPRIVYRWLEATTVDGDSLQLHCSETGEGLSLELGFSIAFLGDAKEALVGVYSVGAELERAGAEASGNGQHLESYLYDVVALELLEKLALQVNRVAEERAGRLGWGVGPVLSPGSVHGWDLEGQALLCSALPLSDIGVRVHDDSVLHPFKSVSFLIGIGPGYDSSEVGSPCEVCSKSDECTMRQDY